MCPANVLIAYGVFIGLLAGCSDQNSDKATASPPSLVQAFAVSTQPPPAVVPAAAPVVPVVAPTEVSLEDDNGTFLVPVTINDAISLKFTIDSGASDVTIPSDVASTLVRAGTISEGDYIGSATAVLADGSEIPSPEFRIRSLRVGNLVLHDVTASITGNNGSLLLGQSFLTRLQNWSIDNNRHVLILNAQQSSSAVANATSDQAPSGANGAANSPNSLAASSNPALGSSAEDAVQRYFAAWSDPADADGQSVRQFYGQSTDYYGRQLSLPELMQEKLKFARRWPSRTYTVRTNSLQSQCSNETGACKVVGLVDWQASSPASSRYSSGTAKFLLILNGGLIVSEHSMVISRN